MKSLYSSPFLPALAVFFATVLSLSASSPTAASSSSNSIITRRTFSDSLCSTTVQSTTTFESGVCQANSGLSGFQSVQSFLISCLGKYSTRFDFKAFSLSNCTGTANFVQTVVNGTCSAYTASGYWETFSSLCDKEIASSKDEATTTIAIGAGVGGGVLVLLIVLLVFYSRIRQCCCGGQEDDEVVAGDGNGEVRNKKKRKYQVGSNDNEMA
jgi:hypothetical protein